MLSVSEPQSYISSQVFERSCACEGLRKFHKKFDYNIIDYMQDKCQVKRSYIKGKGVPVCEYCKRQFQENGGFRQFGQFQMLTVLSLDPINGLENGLFVILVDQNYVGRFNEGCLLEGIILYDQIFTKTNLTEKVLGGGNQATSNKNNQFDDSGSSGGGKLLQNQEKNFIRIFSASENLFIGVQLEVAKTKSHLQALSSHDSGKPSTFSIFGPLMTGNFTEGILASKIYKNLHNYDGFNYEYLLQNLKLVHSALLCFGGNGCKSEPDLENVYLKLGMVLVTCWKLKTEFPQEDIDLLTKGTRDMDNMDTAEKKSRLSHKKASGFDQSKLLGGAGSELIGGLKPMNIVYLTDSCEATGQAIGKFLDNSSHYEFFPNFIGDLDS